MPERSSYDIRQQALMSQRLSNDDPDYQKLAGSDQAISDRIAFLMVLEEFKMIDPKSLEIRFIRAHLDKRRKARFATSERTNEITKMGLQMPKGSNEIDFSK